MKIFIYLGFFVLNLLFFESVFNYKNSYNDLTCQISQDQYQLDTQIHLLSCKEILKDENLVVRNKISYSCKFQRMYKSNLKKML